MGKQTGIIKFTGKLGPLIGYYSGGEYLVRSAPGRIRQSPSTRLAGLQFGKASALACSMRIALRPLLHILPHKDTINALNKKMLGILRADDLHRHKRFIPRHFSQLCTFSFTPGGSLMRTLPCHPDVSRHFDGSIEVHIPAMRAPGSHPSGTHVLVQAIALWTNGVRSTAASSEAVLLEASQPSEAFTLKIEPNGEGVCCILLEAIACQLVNGKPLLLCDQRHMACEVIAVLPPQRTHETFTAVYPEGDAALRKVGIVEYIPPKRE
ncbi:hypothetical protein ACWKWU_20525 [Chitinophaga lutea]